MRLALVCAILTAACAQEPTREFEELPPPRLAKPGVLSSTGERYELAEASSAELTLRHGRRRSKRLSVPAKGWVKLADWSGQPEAGRIELFLDHATYADGSPAGDVSGMGADDGKPLIVEWNPALGQLGDERWATLTVNRHRSDLSIPWGRAKEVDGTPTRIASRDARIGLAEHGMQPRFERRNGGSVQASTADVALKLSLEPPR